MNKLLAVPIRFSRLFATAVLVISGVAAAHELSHSPLLTSQDMKLIQQSKDLASKAQLSEMPDWARTDTSNFAGAKIEATELVQELQRTDPTMSAMSAMQQDKQKVTGEPVVIFASRSLGNHALKEMFTIASQFQDSMVVFRGIPEEANLGEAMMELQQVASQFDPVPKIVINPMLFTQYNVSVVPTIVIREQSASSLVENGDAIARVAGLYNPSWLKEKISSGEDGDFGTRGPVTHINEPDLIELMKRRFASIDWEEKKRAAADNFWKKQTFRELPRAKLGRTRQLDPTIYITEDITTTSGEFIARKGQLINPLDISPFTQAVIVFDPLDEIQVETVRLELARIKLQPDVHTITFIATRLDREDGWGSYKRVTDLFDAPVFLLTPDVLQRFELQFVPAVVTAKGKYFEIEELVRSGEGDQ